jgi:hypothetical protein
MAMNEWMKNEEWMMCSSFVLLTAAWNRRAIF